MAQLFTASFRGVTFHVEGSSISAGRRTVTHQFPMRDEPFTEDLGRGARSYQVSGFVLGDDYIDQVQRLRAVLEEPGPGTLVHPELGEMRVVADGSCTVNFDMVQRRAQVSMTFVEAGRIEFPKTTVATQYASRLSADKLSLSAIEAFAASIVLSGVPDFVKSALQGDLLDALSIVSNAEISAALGLVDSLSGLANSIIDFVDFDPKAFATKLMGAVGLSGLATSVAGWQNVGRSLTNLFDSLHSDKEEPVYGPIKPQSAVVIESNRKATYELFRAAVLVQAIGVSSLIGTDTDSSAQDSALRPGSSFGESSGDAIGESVGLAVDEYEDDSSDVRPTISYDEIKQSQSMIVDRLEDEMLATASDEVFVRLRQSATAVSQDLSDRADGAARLSIFNVGGSLPACVVAKDYYGDAARAREIVVRNAVNNPLFCPNQLRMIDE